MQGTPRKIVITAGPCQMLLMGPQCSQKIINCNSFKQKPYKFSLIGHPNDQSQRVLQDWTCCRFFRIRSSTTVKKRWLFCRLVACGLEKKYLPGSVWALHMPHFSGLKRSAYHRPHITTSAALALLSCTLQRTDHKVYAYTTQIIPCVKVMRFVSTAWVLIILQDLTISPNPTE